MHRAAERIFQHHHFAYLQSGCAMPCRADGPMGFGAAGAEKDRRGQQAIREAREFFRPELMGRLDETVLFDPLGPEQLQVLPTGCSAS